MRSTLESKRAIKVREWVFGLSKCGMRII
jgi:hypothetical protein